MLLLLLVAFPACAQNFPPLTGRVVDQANLLSAGQRTALDAKLAGIEQQTGHQLVVATLAGLEGYNIADYGYRLGRAWGIGATDKNDGAILIVAPNERKVRIEVGYGLEPQLTDAYSSIVINTVIVPKFKGGDYPGGIDAGVDAIAEQIALPPDQAAARAVQMEAQTQRAGRRGGGIDLGAIIWFGVIAVFFILPLIGRIFGGRRYRGGSGLGSVILWSALNGLANSRSSGWGGGSDWGGGGGGFSGGGGSFGGGGASGGW